MTTNELEQTKNEQEQVEVIKELISSSTISSPNHDNEEDQAAAAAVGEEGGGPNAPNHDESIGERIMEYVGGQVASEMAEIAEEIQEARRMGIWGLANAYFKKFGGAHKKSPPRTRFFQILWSWLGAFIGIGAIAAIHYHALTQEHLTLVVGSFGASAVLIFGTYESPLAQPRNLVGGHVVSAIIGVTIRWAVYDQSIAIASGFAVATAIAAMQFTGTTHPPGGATALIAVTSPRMAWGGYLYVFMPILTGCIVMLIVALVVNNLSKSRVYPSWWW